MQARRRLERAHEEGEEERAEAMGHRLLELHQKLRSPALVGLLRNRWWVGWGLVGGGVHATRLFFGPALDGLCCVDGG
jgi:hypothetical protein